MAAEPLLVPLDGLTVRLSHLPAERRYVAELVTPQGNDWHAHGRVGFASYVDSGHPDHDAADAGSDPTAERTFDHTVTHHRYEGKGIAAALVRYALDDTVAAGFRIVPVCSYVVSFVRDHPDWDSHLA
ncbi:GNAT family N-acetyltransferase [Brevibacterium litoralis]|uniref:GNAT family N-acetyltransferase n=1 Tax=Brevibacterium litoralis TaxID=3138935 RepID=UPI0032EB1E0E